MPDISGYEGPNDISYFYSQFIVFGYKRLAISDLNSDASQPMTSHDGRYIVGYNGEISNYLELRVLLKKNIQFKIQSDSEILLNVYVQ